ncbi:MAG: acyl-CoA thioesterase [Rhodobacteraceae bacterium]|nr:acyl-CoA thioesterase [Paracoccaceae bacterium]
MTHRPATAYEHEIRVSWGDCDPARIVYTGKLPAMALEAINGWWEEHLGDGWFQMEIDRNVGTPFVRLEMNFHSPVTPRHRLKCYVWPVKLGDTSIAFRVDGEQDGTLCFSFRSVSVFIVANEFKKRKTPQEMADLITPLLGPDWDT